MMTPTFSKTNLLIVFCTVMAFTLRAQDLMTIKIHLAEEVISIESLLHQISDQAKVVFSYGNNLPLDRKLKFNSRDVSVADILKKVKTETGFSFKLTGNKIVFIPPGRKHTVSGYLRDESSGESLIGANIYSVSEIQGATTNNYGHFSIMLPSDSVVLICSYVGYETRQLQFFLDDDTVVNVGLKAHVLDEVVISGEETVQEITRMSTMELSVQQIKSLPAMAGETDVLKSLQLLPGVQGGPEGSSGLYVRGGSPDQNLILLDGVPVYNASHLFGFFSVFNSDAINHVELIKGGFPARYGGRLSSVVNVYLKEGDQEKIKGEGSLGPIASRLTIEGPIRKGQSSFIISARRTFADLLAKPFFRWRYNGDKDESYSFYDLSAKFNHRINEKNRVYFSVYSGSDRLSTYNRSTFTSDTLQSRSEEKYKLGWGNITSAFRWNCVLSPKIFSNLTATYSNYGFNTVTESNQMVKSKDFNRDDHFRNNYISGIRDFAVKEDVDFFPHPNHAAKTGFYGIYHQFSPGALTYNVGVSRDTVVGSYKINAFEYGGYLEDDITISNRLKSNIGFHVASFNVENRNYASLQPRLALRYLLTPKASLKISYVRMKQFIHLLTNVGIGLPTDLWVPATPVARPEDSWQAASAFTYAPNSIFEFTVEAYYKSMTGLIEYKNGASFLNLDKDWQSKIEIGNGKSYGTEIFLRKKEGKWTGWLGYTLARAYRQFDNIDDGRKFAFKYDRRHDLEIATMYTWNKKIDFAFTWVYGSGLPTTLPTARYPDFSGGIEGSELGDMYVKYYPGRNNFRMRDYHRLDVTISFYKKKKWGERRWVFGLYNAYNRRNPFYLGVKRSNAYNELPKVMQYSLFPVIPAISYNFKF
jgi:hypothetical protein